MLSDWLHVKLQHCLLLFIVVVDPVFSCLYSFTSLLVKYFMTLWMDFNETPEHNLWKTLNL